MDFWGDVVDKVESTEVLSGTEVLFPYARLSNAGPMKKPPQSTRLVITSARPVEDRVSRTATSTFDVSS